MISRQELIGRATELAPVFASRALAEETLRAPSDETIRDMIDSGVLQVVTPKVHGGHEFDLETMARIIAIFSAACPSTGWVSAFYMGAAWRALFYPEQGQRELFADKPYLLCSAQAAPIASVRRAPGGYVLTGQAAWSSGSVHAEWVSFTAVLQEPDEAPQHRVFILPRDEVTVLDNWRVIGMRGTGSNDVRVDEVFVPEHRSAAFGDVMTGTTAGQMLHSNPMYHLPLLPFVMTEVVPVCTGALRGAVTALRERTLARQGTISGVKAANRQVPQMRLGRAMAAVDAVEALFAEYMRLLRRPVEELQDIGVRADMKLRASYIVDLCRNSINDIVRGIGGDGFRDEAPIQRHFRDLNMLAVHAFLDIDTASETAGRLALDLPVDDPLL